MTDVDAAAIATALNSAWNAGTYAKPTTAAGEGFVTDPRTSLWNCITWESGGRAQTYGSLRQVFKLTIRHQYEAAIRYCNTLINALVLASTIVANIIDASPAGSEFEGVIKITVIQS